ncbi:MAG: hypothetical protein CVU39_23735 [Chloroflexi bacterium HGW-Chloroflexi-10]|nr:MAG: hypothetical protein CVU39_23735 [Chloroflexi bacterium HGW-Chloroflexi-10]
MPMEQIMINSQNQRPYPHEEETQPVLPRKSYDEATQPLGTSFNPQPLFQDEPIANLQPIRISNSRAPVKRPQPQQKYRGPGCCVGFVLISVVAVFLLYLFFPTNTNILLLGIDRAPEGSDASRTDTNIVLRVNPLKPTVNMLSIPRDLWVFIPDVGENRINTAHFFAEVNQPGSGPQAAIQAVRQNFGIDIDYYVRIRFDGFTEIVDAMGGINIELPEAMSGYEAGKHQLNGEQALAFARDRSGSDDFFRMQRQQLLIKASIQQLLNPLTWSRIPSMINATSQSMDTDIPLLEIPRIMVAVIRASVGNTLRNETIAREMVIPFTTDGGAQVLAPNWDAINPLLIELFGK